MKTPIEPSEIRAGDLIRWEDGETDDADEFRAPYDYPPYKGWGKHFLIEPRANR
jgi:hypothetical protein